MDRQRGGATGGGGGGFIPHRRGDGLLVRAAAAKVGRPPRRQPQPARLGRLSYPCWNGRGGEGSGRWTQRGESSWCRPRIARRRRQRRWLRRPRRPPQGQPPRPRRQTLGHPRLRQRPPRPRRPKWRGRLLGLPTGNVLVEVTAAAATAALETARDSGTAGAATCGRRGRGDGAEPNGGMDREARPVGGRVPVKGVGRHGALGSQAHGRGRLPRRHGLPRTRGRRRPAAVATAVAAWRRWSGPAKKSVARDAGLSLCTVWGAEAPYVAYVSV